MNKKTKRWVLAGGGAAAVTVIVAGVLVLWPSHEPATERKPDRVAPGVVAQQFFTALASGQAGQAAALTDAADVAGAAIARTRQGMPGATFHAQLGRLPQVADTTTTELDADVTWTLPGGVPLKYATKIGLRLADDQWRVRWSPSLLHPQLTEGQSLAYTTTPADGALVDRTGQPVPPGFAPVVMDSVRKAVGTLDGTPGWQVAVVDQAGAAVAVVQEQKAQAGKSMTVTLDPRTQAAAQAAVDQVGGQQAMLVAIQPSTGEILAVAQNSAVGNDPLALYGRYEPGSTFKVVTATAALTAGLATVDTPVACPGKATIGTRQITNDDSFELGTVPLHQAFAASCNTSFSRLAADLPATALPQAAGYFGLTSDFTVAGITTNTGKIPPAESVPARVEAGIGQGEMQATPFGMALVAATVANGRTPVPRLIREIPTEGQAPAALPGGVAGALRSMMGEVVTGGTARELARYGAVRGKTGTAQFGDGTRSHGWFIGYRGDVAFAVLVVNGGSSKVAVAATGTFLGGL